MNEAGFQVRKEKERASFIAKSKRPEWLNETVKTSIMHVSLASQKDHGQSSFVLASRLQPSSTFLRKSRMSAVKSPFESFENASPTRGGPENAGRSRNWIWWISGLLLLATMLNYMDRQTLANLKVRITTELSLTNEHYGDMEWLFGWAFAAGSLFFGYLSDRISVRFLYPAVLVIWSSIGVLTGYCNGYSSMLTCRILLGFFEAGHWPCALRTTKIVLDRSNRTMGNSILQSGGALGAILTPPVILMIVGDRGEIVEGAWRSPFIIIGSLGIVWAVAWLFTVRGDDLPAPSRDGEKSKFSASQWGAFLAVAIGCCVICFLIRNNNIQFVPSITSIREYFESHLILTTISACLLFLAVAGASDKDFFRESLTNRRFWTLVPVVICINLTWQLIRAWLPAFLQEGRGASEREALWFNSAYYIAADAGCIAAGVASLWLARGRLRVHNARLLVFGICAGMTSLTMIAAKMPLGWGLYGVLLIVAAGSLGLFPCYYSFSQEASERHMGKAAGLLGALAWLVSSPVQKAFGRSVDDAIAATKAINESAALQKVLGSAVEERNPFENIAWVGIAPLIALIILFVVWPHEGATNAAKDGVKPT